MTTTGTADDWAAVARAWDQEIDAVDDAKQAPTTALLDGVRVQPGDRVLELAAGPGSLGARFAQAVGPTGSVLVSDIAPAMVDVAQRRTAGLPNVETAVLDASAIDQPDESFDVVACRMGLMFTPDPTVALGEIHRVLRAGGRLGSLTWAGMEHNPWMTCVGMAAAMTGIVSGGPPVEPGGVFSLADPGRLEELAVGVGFDAVSVTEVEVTFRAESIEAHIDRVASLAGPMAIALAGASPDQRAALVDTATELAAAHCDTDDVILPGLTLLLTATKARGAGTSG